MDARQKELSLNSLNLFQRQYPQSTSGDLQAFVLGYDACLKDLETIKKENEAEEDWIDSQQP